MELDQLISDYDNLSNLGDSEFDQLAVDTIFGYRDAGYLHQCATPSLRIGSLVHTHLDDLYGIQFRARRRQFIALPVGRIGQGPSKTWFRCQWAGAREPV